MSEAAACATVAERPRALFTTAVWGKEYVDRFLNYSLRTQLSAGNIGAFDSRSLYLIVTDAADIERVTGSDAYRALSRLVSTECVAREDIRGSRAGDKYAKLTACQNYALSRSEPFDVIFFGYGDALWADGSYRAAGRLLSEGYDAVFSFGYPVVAGPFAAIMDQLIASSTGQAATIPPRTFAQHVYSHLHPMARSNSWQNRYMGHCPSYVTWNVPGQGLLLRCFHLHPVAVRVRRDVFDFATPFRSTLDEEFVTRLYRTNPRVYVCPSSDEIGVCSLAEENGESYERQPQRTVSAGALAEFAEAYAGLMHRELFMHSVRLVVDDVCHERWRTVESQAAQLAAEITRRLAIPDCMLALEAPAAYVERWRRQANFAHLSLGPVNMRRKDLEVSQSVVASVRTGARHKIAESGHSTATTMLAAAQRKIAEIGQSTATTMRVAGRRVGHGAVRMLRSLYITRAAKVVVLPYLSPRQRGWCHDVANRLGINVPLVSKPQGATLSLSFARRLQRWVLNWLRVEAR